LLDDLIGPTGKQKRVAELRNKMVEMGPSTAVESYAEIARLVSIGTSDNDFGGVGMLLLPIIGAAQRSASVAELSPKELANYLRHVLKDGVATGLLGNAEANLEKLLPFAYLLVKNNLSIRDTIASSEKLHGLSATEAKAKQKRTKRKHAVYTVIAPDDLETTIDPRLEADINSRNRMLVEARPSPNRPAESVVNEVSSSSFLLAEFGVEIIDELLETGDQKIDWTNEKQLAMLDPFVALLADCLDDTHPTVANASLRVLTHLLTQKTGTENTMKLLPSLEGCSVDIITRVMSLIEGNMLSNSESAIQTFSSGFDLIAALLQRGRNCSFVSDSGRAGTYVPRLLKLISSRLSRTAGMTPSVVRACFGLLNVIISQQLPSAQVYDIIDRVTVMSVTTNIENARLLSVKLIIKFLVTYPQSDRRRLQTIDFYMKNIDYETVAGRKAVLAVLDGAVAQLPTEDICERAEALFLALVARFFNESEQELKELIVKVIKDLFRAVDDKRASALLTLILGWMRNTEDTDMQRIALQLYGILADCGGSAFWRRFVPALPFINTIMKNGVEVLNDEKEHGIADVTSEPAGWQLLYHALLAVEKVLAACPAFLTEGSSDALDDEFWSRVCELTRYRHAWVQLVCFRLIGQLFSRNTPEAVGHVLMTSEEDPKVTPFLTHPESLKMLDQAFLYHVQAGRGSPQCAEQVLRDMVFYCRVCIAEPDIVVVSDEQRKGVAYGALTRFVKKLSLLIPQLLVSMRICSYKLFAAVATLLPPVNEETDDKKTIAANPLVKMLPLIMEPLYRSVNDISHKHTTKKDTRPRKHDSEEREFLDVHVIDTRDDEKKLANEVLSVLKQVVGDRVYLSTYNSIRKKYSSQMAKLEQKRKQLAITNPSLSSKLKLDVGKGQKSREARLLARRKEVFR